MLRLTLTHEGETLLMKALKVHMALIEKAMSQSTPAECDHDRRADAADRGSAEGGLRRAVLPIA